MGTPVQFTRRMIYLMEVGPLFPEPLTSWVVFSIEELADGTTRISPRVSSNRFTARREMATYLKLKGVTGIRCCPELGDYGYSRGWKVEKPSRRFLELAGATMVSVQMEWVLGAAAFSPAVIELLKACAKFLEARAWVRHSAMTPVRVGERVAVVMGRDGIPPSLIVLPDHEAFERAQSRERHRSRLDDAIIVTLDGRRTPPGQTIAAGYGRSFAPSLIRMRHGRLSALTEVDVQTLISALITVSGDVDQSEITDGP